MRANARTANDLLMLGHYLLVSSHDALARSGVTVRRTETGALDSARAAARHLRKRRIWSHRAIGGRSLTVPAPRLTSASVRSGSDAEAIQKPVA